MLKVKVAIVTLCFLWAFPFCVSRDNDGDRTALMIRAQGLLGMGRGQKELQRQQEKQRQTLVIKAKTTDAPEVDLASGVTAADQTREVPAVDQTREVTAVDKTREVTAVDKTREVTAVDQTREVPAVDQTREVTAVDKTREVPAVDKTREVLAVDQTREVPAVDLTSVVTTVDLGSRVPAADQTRELPETYKLLKLRLVTVDAAMTLTLNGFNEVYLFIGKQVQVLRDGKFVREIPRRDLHLADSMKLQAAFVTPESQAKRIYYGDRHGKFVSVLDNVAKRRLRYGPARAFIRDGGPGAAARRAGKVYIFKGCKMAVRKAWNDWGVPVNVTSIGLPCDADAAWNEDGNMVVLKGDQIWRWNADDTVRGPNAFGSAYRLKKGYALKSVREEAEHKPSTPKPLTGARIIVLPPRRERPSTPAWYDQEVEPPQERPSTPAWYDQEVVPPQERPSTPARHYQEIVPPQERPSTPARHYQEVVPPQERPSTPLPHYQDVRPEGPALKPQAVQTSQEIIVHDDKPYLNRRPTEQRPDGGYYEI